MVADVAIPAAMIEAAAVAAYVSDLNASIAHGWKWPTSSWAQLQVAIKERYRAKVRPILAAALGVCEVREQWGCRYHDLHPEDGLPMDTTWWSPKDDRREAEEVADSKPWGFHARVIRRLVITTPPEPVDTEGAPT